MRKVLGRRVLAVIPGADAAIMIVSMLVAIAAFMTAMGYMTGNVEGVFVKLITDMPGFDFQIVDGEEHGNPSFLVYSLLRDIAYVWFVMVFLLVGILIMFKQANLVTNETIKKMFLGAAGGIILLLVFPYIWDPISEGVEMFSLSLLNPMYSFDDSAPCIATNGTRGLMFMEQNQKIGRFSLPLGLEPSVGDLCKPDLRVSYLFAKARYGAELGFDWDDGLLAIPNILSQLRESIYSSIFTGLSKTVMIFFMATMTAVIGNMRFLLVDVIAISLPLLLVFRSLPFFYIDKISNTLLSAWVPLVLVPIFSSLIILAGTTNLLQAEEKVETGVDRYDFWLHAMSTMALAVMIPVMLAPVLGSVSSMIGMMVMTGTMSGVMGTMGAAQGASAGVMRGMAGRFSAGKNMMIPSGGTGAFPRFASGTGGIIGGLKSVFGKSGIKAMAGGAGKGLADGGAGMFATDMAFAARAAPGGGTGGVDMYGHPRGIGLVDGGIRPGLTPPAPAAAAVMQPASILVPPPNVIGHTGAVPLGGPQGTSPLFHSDGTTGTMSTMTAQQPAPMGTSHVTSGGGSGAPGIGPGRAMPMDGSFEAPTEPVRSVPKVGGSDKKIYHGEDGSR